LLYVMYGGGVITGTYTNKVMNLTWGIVNNLISYEHDRMTCSPDI
jgi:hypothetical protein